MTFNPEVAAKMDKAADQAKLEFDKIKSNSELLTGIATMEATVQWMNTHYKTAGYTRCSKIIRGIDFRFNPHWDRNRSVRAAEEI